jgi:aminoacrylate hydrolase
MPLCVRHVDRTCSTMASVSSGVATVLLLQRLDGRRVSYENQRVPTLRHQDARISYTRTGTGPAVLLVQGVGVVGAGWTPQVEGLRDRYTVICFDNRGIGASTLGSAPLSIDAMAADALAIMDAEGLDSFHLAGHSMGGLIAQAIALSATSRVRSLALLCTFASGADATALTWPVLAAGIRTRVGTRRMRRRAFLDLVMPPMTRAASDDPDALAASLALLFGRDLADQPPIVMQQLRAMRPYTAGTRLADLESTPTLVLSASHDLIARPNVGARLAKAIPGARLVEIDDAGHGVTIQRAPRVNALLDGHFRAADEATLATTR